MYVHVNLHAYSPPYACIYAYTQTHTLIFTNMHDLLHNYIHVNLHAYSPLYHVCMNTYAYTQTHTLIFTNTYRQIDKPDVLLQIALTQLQPEVLEIFVLRIALV